ncbi:MAG: 4-hydroxy-tetrahydrodipicolinate reductase [Actinomycetota bacterium]|nr:4-hydroxy-tetrahydrodipicolinate reductase [Actinomycetota bacterium]
MIKVGVIGAEGRMGSEVCRAVEADPDLDLVARVGRSDDLTTLGSSGCEVAVEFTEPASVKANTLSCLTQGIHVVVGATGLTDPDLQEIEAAAREHGVSAFIAPNFALGAVLMMRFAAEAARHFRSAEIIERHHERKLDAPSGTAKRTASLMEESGFDGDVPIHSVRLPGLVAHQEVVFGAPGETLTIKHDSIDRTSFMPGVVLAIKKVSALPPLTVGLEHLLHG